MENMRTEEQLNQTKFDEAYREATTQKYANTNFSKYISPLSIELNSQFTTAEGDRKEKEECWLQDLRQYRGEYDPDVLSKMHPKRSKAFLSLTRPKTKTVTAREMDILFPANGDKNWGIETTPIPELNPMLEQQIIEAVIAQGGEEPDQLTIKKYLNEEAKKRADAMETEIHDQLSELQYRSIINNVIRSGNIYGTGILKGPLVKEQVSKRWLPDGSDGWVTVEFKKLMPYCEFVSLWDIYPDMTARKAEDMRYIWQRYVMNRNQVFELGKRSDFNSEAINAYLQAYKSGDAQSKTHEEELRGLSSGKESTTISTRSGKYDVKEFWGYISTEKLIAAGLEIDEDQIGLEVAANIWMLGPMIIKAMVSPIEGVNFPYHFYYYDKDETSIFGEGIPYVMRDTQSLFNASIRAMLDNAAISAGPIIEANIDLLAEGEDPTDIYPHRVFARTGSGHEASQRAIHVNELPSYTNEYLTMVKFFFDTADEVTAVPRYLQGDNTNLGGAGRTATGLSMLMGAAHITLKDQIKNFDDGITKPYIKAQYFWNMEFNPKEEIKGDFNILCKGNTSLIAKEVRTESLLQFLQLTANPVDLLIVKRDNALREIVKAMDLDEYDLIKPREEVQIEQAELQQQQDEDKEREYQLQEMKADSGGHTSNGESTSQRPKMERLDQAELERGQIPEVTNVGVQS